jgi:hypothetical protein
MGVAGTARQTCVALYVVLRTCGAPPGVDSVVIACHVNSAQTAGRDVIGHANDDHAGMEQERRPQACHAGAPLSSHGRTPATDQSVGVSHRSRSDLGDSASPLSLVARARNTRAGGRHAPAHPLWFCRRAEAKKRHATNLAVAVLLSPRGPCSAAIQGRGLRSTPPGHW